MDIPSEIKADGSVDVTAGLLSFFESVPDDTEVVFPAGAQYRVDGTLLFEDRAGLTFTGNQARIFAVDEALGERNRSQLVFQTSTGITLRNLRIDGAYTDAGQDSPYHVDEEAQHTLHFAACSDILVEDCEFHYTFGDLIYINHHRPRLFTANVVVRGCYGTHSGRQGFTVAGGDNVLFERCVVDDIKRTGIDLEPPGSGGAAHNVTIRDNYIGLTTNGSVNATGELGDLTIENNALGRCGFRFSGANADGSGRAGTFTFRGNHALTVKPANTAGTMIVSGFEDVFVQSNVQQFGGNKKNYHRFLTVSDCRHVTVSGNLLPGLQPARIVTVNDDTPTTVADNTFWPLGYAVGE